MSDENLTRIQGLLDQLNEGIENAANELTEVAHHRLREIAAMMLGRSFPIVKRIHDTDSIVNETWLQLHQALNSVKPQTASHFFGLAYKKTYEVCLKLAQADRRRWVKECQLPLNAEGEAVIDPSDSTYDPTRLADWGEFHRRVEALDGQMKEVFVTRWFGNLQTQAATAEATGIHVKQVSRLWLAAEQRVFDGLKLL